MWKKRNFQLSDIELKSIEQTMHHDKRPEVRQKAQAIHLLHLGQSAAQTGTLCAVVGAAAGVAWPQATSARLNRINRLSRTVILFTSLLLIKIECSVISNQ